MSGAGPGAPPRRRDRSGRTAVFIIVGVAGLGGLGFGLWAGLTRKAPPRAGDPGSGIPMEGLGVRRMGQPDTGAPVPAAAPAGATPPAQPATAAPPPPAPADGRAPGQTLREIQALVAEGKISAARAVAEKFLKTTPTGKEAEEIMGLTGVHPRP